MKIDTNKIENFDKMSDAEKIDALLGYEADEPKVSEDVQKLKNALNKASSETAEYKKLLREKQTEAERAEAERKEAQAKMLEELNTLKRDKSVAEHLSKLVGFGFDSELAKETAEAMADGDLTAMYNGFGKFIEKHDAAIKADIVKGTPSPVSGGSVEKTITKEDFNKMSYTDRLELFNQNKELYDQLNN